MEIRDTSCMIGRMITIETSIRIDRPAEAVFALLSDPLRLPLWNSAVESVRPAGPGYAMRRRLPGGPADNQLEITASEAPSLFAIRTTSGPTPFSYAATGSCPTAGRPSWSSTARWSSAGRRRCCGEGSSGASTPISRRCGTRSRG